MRRTFRLTTLAAALMMWMLPFGAQAVTQQEMEEARTITAFWYLRYANNGAGYMEEGKMPTTMAQLEKMLKETERTNLKAFKAVSVPQDYAGWDKKKLVGYWGGTFFNSPGLSAQGKVARSRVEKKINAMTISAPAAAAQPSAAAPEAAVAAATETPKEATAPAAGATEMPDASQIVNQAQVVDSTALAVEESALDSRPERKSSSSTTWIYIVALCILVGVVVWLVIFASKTMQQGNQEAQAPAPAPVTPPHVEDEPLAHAPAGRRRQTQQEVIEEHNEPIIPEPAVAAPGASHSAEVGALNREIKNLREECLRLGEENGRLQSDLADARRELEALRGRLRAAGAVTSAASVAGPQPRPAAQPERPAAPAPTPRREPEEPMHREIYLGRVNPRGLFVRADKRPVEEKSVFVLTTTDGYTGTYRVIQLDEVIERCLDNPEHYLGGGCTAPDLLATEEATAIRTLQSGTAVFEDGCWRMIRKTKIVYE